MRSLYWILMCGIVTIGSRGSRADDPKPADGDAKLAEGFPTATKPDTIEVKRYPAYRSAVARGQGMTQGSGDMLFWNLFGHIQRNGVEMTAPVINTYKTPKMLESPREKGEVTMEFVYPTLRDGKTGPDTRVVSVEDHPASDFVCLGFQGAMNDKRMSEGMTTLKKWLEEHKSEWIADGPPRRLGYHGPMTPARRRLWELQIPVKPASKSAAPKTD